MPTRFYKEREHTAEALEVHRARSSTTFFPIFVLPTKIKSLCERYYRPSQQGLQGEKISNPNLLIIFFIDGFH